MTRLRLLYFDPALSRWVTHVDGPHVGNQGPFELRLGTWNIWFDTEGDPEARWSALFEQVLGQTDVVGLQEVVQRSYALLLARGDVRREWLVVDFEDVLQQTSSWYGTMILVRRSWMNKVGVKRVGASLVRYEGPMRRSLVAVELSDAVRVVLRIGTSHWESGTEDVAIRRRQFLAAARAISLPSSTSISDDASPSSHLSIDTLTRTISPPSESPPSILCGDSNLTFADELDVLTSPRFAYSDAYAQLHWLADAYASHPTFYTTYPVPSPRPDMRQKRIDVVLVRGCEVLEARRVGDEPVRDAEGRKREDRRGRDGKMFPSDHLGVVVRLTLGRVT